LVMARNEYFYEVFTVLEKNNGGKSE